MNQFDPGLSLLGGALIGLAAVATLLLSGRLAGISGIFASVLAGTGEPAGEAPVFRTSFLAGLVAGAILLRLAWPGAFELPAATPGNLARFAVAGLLVGLGSRLGGGCTSGHGVCGLGLRSPRSLAATLTFMTAAVLVVFVSRHLGGGAS